MEPDESVGSQTTPEELGRTYAAMVGMEEAVNSPPEPATLPSPLRIIEALLFVGGAPLTAKRAREILRGLSKEEFERTVSQLNADYRRQFRPYLIQPQGDGWALTLRPNYRYVIDKLYGGVREARLSQPAIETLSLVAYRQPIAKSDIDSIRGADSGALLRQLIRRGLIQIMATTDAKPKDAPYITTLRFLEIFGLQSLDDLPRTHDLQQI
jgi:segregation and condensation protein B